MGTMEKNFTVLGPYVLPLSEQIRVAYSLAKKKICKYLWKLLNNRNQTATSRLQKLLSNWVPVKIPTYVPDFKRGIDYWCIHAGGRAVVDGLKTLNCSQNTQSQASMHFLTTGILPLLP